MGRFKFAKYEGIGNDFIVVEAADLGARDLTSDDAVALCDRHRGVGADGVLVVRRGATPYMGVINSDGSQPEMCGNGIRCVALHLTRTGAVRERVFEIDTAAGVHRCELSRDGRTVSVAMRPASFSAADIPLSADGPWINQAVDIGTRTLSVTAVSMGNPHVVVFDDVGEARFDLAPALQQHSQLREGANVGFATMRTKSTMTLHVLERGAGWTQACGTGACAAVSAAVETGRADRGRPVDVALPGGVLQITVNGPGKPVWMNGPATHVFDGETSLLRS